MAGKHDVWVFRDGSDYFVRPGTAVGDAGKPFKVRNLTDYTIRLNFPPGLMEPGPPRRIPPRGRETYHVERTADGVYTYRVEILRRLRKKKAKGESGPRIIIDP